MLAETDVGKSTANYRSFQFSIQKACHEIIYVEVLSKNNASADCLLLWVACCRV